MRSRGIRAAPCHGNVVAAGHLAAIGPGAPTWTVVYAAQASRLRSSRVAFVPIGIPRLTMTMPMALAFPAQSAVIEALLEACRLVAND